MSSPDTIDTLNRVLEILERSFPQYLRWARPFIPPGRENVMQTIDTIVAGQDALAERVSQQVFEAGGLPDHGDFAIEFTDTHDLDIDFLVAEAIDCLRQDIADLEQCVDALRLAPSAQSLASEALGLTKGDLELLEKIPLDPGASTVRGPQTAMGNN
jgi:hypothetical protein